MILSATKDKKRSEIRGDVGVVQFGQHFPFGLHVVAVGDVVGDLEHEFLVGRVLPRKNALENKGTTPVFPVHTPEADANAPSMAKPSQC